MGMLAAERVLGGEAGQREEAYEAADSTLAAGVPLGTHLGALGLGFEPSLAAPPPAAAAFSSAADGEEGVGAWTVA